MSSIINNMPSVNSVVSATCYAGALALAGNKIGLAVGCKTMSIATGLLGKKDASADWNESAKKYSELARKNVFRDLTLASSLIALGIGSKCLGNCPTEEKTEDFTSYLTEEFKKMYEERYQLLGAYFGVVVPMCILSVKIAINLANISATNDYVAMKFFSESI